MRTEDPGGIGVLRGWKEIAQYLRTSERTATRWATEKALPVHRGGHGLVVMAYRLELDRWQREMAGSATGPRLDSSPGVGGQSRWGAGARRFARAGLVLLGVAVVVAVLGLVQSHKVSLTRTDVPAGDGEALGHARFVVRLEPNGLEPASVLLTDGGSATVDFPGRPTLLIKARRSGVGVIVSVAGPIAANGLQQPADETVFELAEGTRARLKRPFPLLLTWQRKNAER